MEAKQRYESPTTIVVDVKVGGMLCTSVGMNSGFGTQGLENRQNGGLWGGNDW